MLLGAGKLSSREQNAEARKAETFKSEINRTKNVRFAVAVLRVFDRSAIKARQAASKPGKESRE